MSEEPNLPPVVSIGDVITRKDNMKEYKTSTFQCNNCGKRIQRPFQEGDYVFKRIRSIKCVKCRQSDITITEIYAEFRRALNISKKSG